MITPKMERKYMAHFIDSASLGTEGTTTSSWYWLGDDLSDFSIELNPSVEVERDLLGNEHIIHDYYEPEAEVDTFFARQNDGLFAKLQAIIDNMYTGSRCNTFTLDVHLWGNPVWGDVTSAPSTENPKQNGWYELINGVYVPSTDTSADPTKTYYYMQYPAVRRRCYVVPSSFGGNTSGYQIPFIIKYYNSPSYPVVTGLFNVSSREFVY